jgi:S-adenosylmethionine synthetase
MSLEAAAGKNPISHVGKIYNVVARRTAESLVATSADIVRAECLIVSKIGAPVTKPAIVEIRLATANGVPAARFREIAEEIADGQLARIPRLADEFASGLIQVF